MERQCCWTWQSNSRFRWMESIRQSGASLYIYIAVVLMYDLLMPGLIKHDELIQVELFLKIDHWPFPQNWPSTLLPSKLTVDPSLKLDHQPFYPITSSLLRSLIKVMYAPATISILVYSEIPQVFLFYPTIPLETYNHVVAFITQACCQSQRNSPSTRTAKEDVSYSEICVWYLVLWSLSVNLLVAKWIPLFTLDGTLVVQFMPSATSPLYWGRVWNACMPLLRQKQTDSHLICPCLLQRKDFFSPLWTITNCPLVNFANTKFLNSFWTYLRTSRIASSAWKQMMRFNIWQIWWVVQRCAVYYKMFMPLS